MAYSFGRFAGGATGSAIGAAVMGGSYAMSRAFPGEEPAADMISSMWAPSLPESVTYGLMLGGARSHRGLTSGGLVGYSSFFTGYAGGGPMRNISVGRLGLGAIGRAAGFAASLSPAGKAQDMLRHVSQTARYGFTGMSTAQSAADVAKAIGMDAASSADDVIRQYKTHANILRKSDAYRGLSAARRARVDAGEGAYRVFRWRNAEAKAAAAYTDDVVNTAKGVVKAATGEGLGAKLAGFLGGGGYTHAGDYVPDLVNVEGKLVQSAAKGSGIAFGGARAAWLGRAANWTLAAQLLGEGIKYGAHLVGESYKNATSITSRIHESLGMGPTQLGPGFTNRIAATERQRAIMALNSSSLNPRGQMMGNEAALLR